jgi:ornithine cyclodeaminase/alanine dehydrogenase-like protein (mu-crystallin family)
LVKPNEAITVFKSVGTSIEDLGAAILAKKNVG